MSIQLTPQQVAQIQPPEIIAALREAGCGILRRQPLVKQRIAARTVPEPRIQPPEEVTDEAPPEVLTLARLLRIVSRATGVAMADLISNRRDPRFVRARVIYYTLAREFTTKSLPGIAKACGDRDHTTILHGTRCHAKNPQAYEPEFSRIRDWLHAKRMTP